MTDAGAVAVALVLIVSWPFAYVFAIEHLIDAAHRRKLRLHRHPHVD